MPFTFTLLFSEIVISQSKSVGMVKPLPYGFALPLEPEPAFLGLNFDPAVSSCTGTDACFKYLSCIY